MRQEKRAPQDRELLTTAGTEKQGSLSFPVKPVATGISKGENNAVKGQDREQEKPDFNSASKKLFKAGRSPSWMEMMSFLGMMIFLTSSVLVAQGNLGQFAFMIKALTGKHAIPNYTTYGCYCGLGGKGRARDATDRCCLVHDCCYDKLSKCNPKTNKYQYSYQNGVITCGPGSWCEIQICECDKAAAICFRENLNSYDQKLRFYWDIHCKEPTEPC